MKGDFFFFEIIHLLFFILPFSFNKMIISGRYIDMSFHLFFFLHDFIGRLVTMYNYIVLIRCFIFRCHLMIFICVLTFQTVKYNRSNITNQINDH